MTGDAYFARILGTGSLKSVSRNFRLRCFDQSAVEGWLIDLERQAGIDAHEAREHRRRLALALREAANV